jgi:DNA-directed RNA polymerase specialized sigma24 family protein
MSDQGANKGDVEVDETEGEFLSTAEISAKIAALSPADQRKLRKAANFISRTNGLDEGQALLQEAMVRAFEGRRRCRCDLEVVPFLFGAMRSIAHSAAKSAKRSPVNPYAELPEDVDEVSLKEARDRADLRNPERDVVANDMIQKIDDLFKEDQPAREVLLAMADGYQGDELREVLGIDKTQHNTIRKRILRHTEELGKLWGGK